MRQLKRVLTVLAIVLTVASASLAMAQDRDESVRGNLFLDNGDLVTASGKNDSLLRFRPRNNSLVVTKQSLGVRLKPKGIAYIGNGSQLLWLANKQLFSLCSGQPFKRINGLDISSDLRIYLVDGFDIFGESEIYRLDNVAKCKLRLLADGAMVNGVQGLAIGLPAR